MTYRDAASPKGDNETGTSPGNVGQPWGDEPRPAWFRRFVDKIDWKGQTSCWTWMSNKLPAGYGQFTVGPKGASPKYAHRLAYELWCGPIPSGKFVLHTCDNPSCVNPDHLWLGTQLDNMRDRHAKGWLLKDRKKP